MKTKRSGLKVMYGIFILMPLIGLINSLGLFVLVKAIDDWQDFYWKILQKMQSYAEGFIDGFLSYFIICLIGFAFFVIVGLHLCDCLGFTVIQKDYEPTISHLPEYDANRERQRVAEIVKKVRTENTEVNRNFGILTYTDYKNSLQKFSKDLCTIQSKLHDDVVKHNVAEINRLTQLILKNTDDTEYNKGNLRRLPTEYIPTVQHLIQAYAGLNNDNVDTEEVNKTKEIISDALTKIVIMFENLLKESMSQDLMSLQVDTSVLLQKAELNGLYNQNDITRCVAQNK
jgi:hypothetical protein